MAEDFLSVKNLDRFQHYKHRNPPWIKFYREFWTDHVLLGLTPLERLTFLGCCSLAAELENKIPNDPKYLSHRLGLKCTASTVSTLLSSSLLCLYSTLSLREQKSASCLQDASKEPVDKVEKMLAARKQKASNMLADRESKGLVSIGSEIVKIADKHFPPV